MAIYRAVGGVNREIKSITRGVSGVNRDIQTITRSVGGVNQKVYVGTLYLYDNGNEFVNVTGGWEGISYFNSNNVIGFKTKNYLDLSKYTKIHILLSSYNKANTQGRYCVFVSKTDVYPANAYWYYLNENEATHYDTEVVHDISSATSTGNLYIGTFGGGANYTHLNAYSKEDGYLQATLYNADRTVKIYKIWLE